MDSTYSKQVFPTEIFLQFATYDNITIGLDNLIKEKLATLQACYI